jgi:hypothetical protein
VSLYLSNLPFPVLLIEILDYDCILFTLIFFHYHSNFKYCAHILIKKKEKEKERNNVNFCYKLDANCCFKTAD